MYFDPNRLVFFLLLDATKKALPVLAWFIFGFIIARFFGR